MQFHQALHDGQTQSGTAMVAPHAAIDLIEALEDHRHVLGCDPLAGIRHLHDHRQFLDLEVDPDMTAAGRELDGVFDQVEDNLRHAGLVEPEQRNLAFLVVGHLHALGVGDRHQGLDGLLDQGAQVPFLDVELEATRLEPREGQEIFDQTDEAFNAAIDAGEHLGPLGGREFAVAA